MLGKQWKSESEHVKAHFKALADEIKEKHARDYPDYQYAPRKPHEKKRRAPARRTQTPASPISGQPQNSGSSPPLAELDMAIPVDVFTAAAQAQVPSGEPIPFTIDQLTDVQDSVGMLRQSLGSRPGTLQATS
jgi:HMG (high mobility group) box